MLNLHCLQYTLFFFIPAIILCLKLKRWIGVYILVSNFFCSFIVHRLKREEELDYSDYSDRFLIFLWALYNTYLSFKILTYLNTNIDVVILFYFILSIIGAYLTYYYDKSRLIVGKWRSKEQDLSHGLMHFFGGIGTFFLLLAINKIDKNIVSI